MTIDEAAKEFMDAACHFLSKRYLAANNEAKRLISAIKFESFRELSYRLKYHDFNEHYCKICGKPVHYGKYKSKFPTYCSNKCEFQDPAVYEKRRKSNIKKYGQPVWNNPDKTTKTCFERYGSGRNKEKIQATMMQRYGVKSYLSLDEINSTRDNPDIQSKIQESKRRNGTFNKSNVEEKIYEILKAKFKNVNRQFKSEKYPFNYDFYIEDINAYIECNFHWTHGLHPFNPSSDNDMKKLEMWREKAKTFKFYKNAIDAWTNRDIIKRETARKNGVNLIEFWSFNEAKEYLLKGIQ